MSPHLLSSLPAQARDRRLALAVAGVSFAVLALMAPFARTPVGRIEMFIPAYQTALLLTDLATLALLLGHWHVSRSRGMAVLAAAYLFTAVMTVAHTLSFPGLFAPQGLLGAGQQSTAWIYMFWHAAFPAFVIAYAHAGRGRMPAPGMAGLALGTVGAALALIAIATAGESLLPAIMRGSGYSPAYLPTVTLVWLTTAAALVALWRRPAKSVLDVWLMVVMCVWACDIALSAVLNAGRFDLGFYAGRSFGLLAASFLLWILLFESTTLYRRIAAAEQAQLEAQDANRAKDEFIAMLGHELRNPLNAMTLAADILHRTDDPALTAPARKIISRQAMHLGRLVDDLLDVGRAVFGKVRINREPVELASIVHYQARLLEQTGQLDRHRFEEQLEEAWVDGDPTRLNQVVGNLLANAVKFTPEDGSIVLTLAREGDAAVLRVRDTGIGMDRALIGRVFDPFVQGERPGGRPMGGLGIGLTLARRLVELHGGTIAARSDGVGMGSEFTVRLPVITAAPVADDRGREQAHAAGARCSVVIVEDNDDARESLRRVLQLHGHEVHEAADGPAGARVILQVLPDIALVDIGLPQLDGYGVARLVRERATRPVRLIALTGYGEEAENPRRQEFDQYVVKPLDPVALEELLTQAAAARPSASQLQSH